MVSVWWDDEPRFYGDLNAGYLAVNDQGPGISLSGTQVAVLAVACVFLALGAELGITCLVETHTSEEVRRALDAGAVDHFVPAQQPA